MSREWIRGEWKGGTIGNSGIVPCIISVGDTGKQSIRLKQNRFRFHTNSLLRPKKRVEFSNFD